VQAEAQKIRKELDKTFDAIDKSDDYGYKIICGLTSENQKRGHAVRFSWMQ